MGYDIHITRKVDWSDEDGPEIALEEWLALVDSDTSLRLDGSAEAQTPDGVTIRVESDGLAVWTGHPDATANVGQAWFSYEPSGSVSVKNPDAAIMRKMHEIAQRLNAKVQGDEGEDYELEELETPEPTNGKRKWWKR